MSDRSRRAVLSSLAAGSVSLLAGCNSTASDDTNSGGSGTGTAGHQPTQTQAQANSGSSGVIETVETATTQTTTALGETEECVFLRVSVTDASVDAVALRNSAGKEVARKQLGTGTTTQFPLQERAADTYDILAVKGDSIVDERSKTFKRTYSVDDVSLVAKKGIESDKMGYEEIQATITNTGDLPITFTGFGVTGDVPTPAEGYSPIGDSEDDTRPLVPPTESQALTSQTTPIAGWRSKFDCSGNPKTGEITLETKAGNTTTISFEYSLSGERIAANSGSSCTKSELYSWNVTSSE